MQVGERALHNPALGAEPGTVLGAPPGGPRLPAEVPKQKDKRIRELEMERDVCKRFAALWVK